MKHTDTLIPMIGNTMRGEGLSGTITASTKAYNEGYAFFTFHGKVYRVTEFGYQGTEYIVTNDEVVRKNDVITKTPSEIVLLTDQAIRNNWTFESGNGVVFANHTDGRSVKLKDDFELVQWLQMLFG